LRILTIEGADAARFGIFFGLLRASHSATAASSSWVGARSFMDL
jgi:hypothetical protein